MCEACENGAAPYLVDLTGWPAGATNEAVEWLYKARLDADEDRIWTPHRLATHNAAEELWHDAGAEPLRKTYEALCKRLDLPVNPAPFTKAVTVDLLTKANTPGGLPFTLDQALDAVDWAISLFMPGVDVSAAVGEALAIRSYLIGMMRDAWERENAAALRTKIKNLPRTMTHAGRTFRMGEHIRNAVKVASLYAGDLISELTDTTRHRVKRTILRGVGTGQTQAQLGQALFDSFATQNRDWRRVAVTEAAMAANGGHLATCALGSFVIRRELPGACAGCRSFDGFKARVVAPDDPDRDWDRDVWIGKTNEGRSFARRKRLPDGSLVERSPDEMAVICPVLHPNCRGYFDKAPSGKGPRLPGMEAAT